MELDEDGGGGKSSQIFFLTWVKRGAAKLIPDQIHLNAEEMKNIMSEDPTQEEDEWEDVDSDTACSDKNDVEAFKKDSKSSDKDSDLDEYNMDEYDDEEGDFSGVGGLIMFADNEEDPYMTKKKEQEGGESSDSEQEEEEKSSVKLRPDDNLLACARCGQHSSELEIYVYNHNLGDFYVHHDIPLMEAPLCMQWIGYDPGDVDSNYKGNLIALGNFNSTIDIWDLDVLNTLEPVFSIGKNSSKETRNKTGRIAQFSHTDALLDLSWTENLRDTLASCSADTVVALWDLELGKNTQTFRDHQSKVQSIEWRPNSTDHIISGGFDGRVILLDKKAKEGVSHWSLDGEIERLAWHPTDDNYFAAGTDSGLVYYMDCRKSRVYLNEWSAHKSAIPALVLSTVPSSKTPLIYTASSDGFVKVWSIEGDKPKLVHEKNTKIGMVHCCTANPDVPQVLACGGQKDSIRLWDVTKTSDIARLYGVKSNRGKDIQDTLSPLGGGGENDDDVLKYIEGEDYIDHEKINKLIKSGLGKSSKKSKKKKTTKAPDTGTEKVEIKPVLNEGIVTKKQKRRRKRKKGSNATSLNGI